MTAREESFLATLTSLWLRLSTVAVVGLLYFLVLILPERLAGWRFYLSPAEVFEVAVFAVFMALTGVAVGAIGAVVIAPILFYRQSSRRHVVEIATRVAVAIAAFLDFGITLTALTRWANLWGTAKTAVFACCYLAFAAALCIPRRREQLVTSLDGFLDEKSTRRAVRRDGRCGDALVAVEAAMGKTRLRLQHPDA